MKVWVLVGRTESGDAVGPYVFKDEPDQDAIDEILSSDFPDDFEIGYIEYYVEGIEVIE